MKKYEKPTIYSFSLNSIDVITISFGDGIDNGAGILSSWDNFFGFNQGGNE